MQRNRLGDNKVVLKSSLYLLKCETVMSGHIIAADLENISHFIMNVKRVFGSLLYMSFKVIT